jgi:adenosylcobyric acid synthase
VTALAPVLMVQGTASSAGKSTLVAGLCRWLAQSGLRVAPFKAQNMSNNAAVCADGGEIGRAQFAQAIAAGIEPTVDMNPILLKPQGRSSQVIVRGQARGKQTAAEYFGPAGLRRNLWPTVVEALDRLRSEYDLVIAEGAGSPAEINLRERDVVNMRVALHAEADVLIVSDIDRGGAFAALLGTWEWLAPDERALVRGFILNKFRGDPSLLAPAPELLEQRTGVPVVGVVPYLDNLVLPEEDAASLTQRPDLDARVEIAVIRLPHLANFDEFGLLAAEPGVSVRYVSAPESLRAPDLVILPGTKATIPDLRWLHDRGLSGRLRWLVTHGTPVLGICGGYQMLGQVVRDPRHVESDDASGVGIGRLPLETELDAAESKRLARTHGVVRANAPGIWAGLGGVQVEGYEIHVGRTWGQPPDALLELPTGPDGSVTPDGMVAGTYLHGIFEQTAARHALVQTLAHARGFTLDRALTGELDPYVELARVLAETVRLDTTRVPALIHAQA